ncbi:MAG: hypothetical protein AB7N91_32835 [Candidatus Tectimicrobiota bacterium]
MHLTEACDDALPHLMTKVHTTAAPTGDTDALPAMPTALAHAALLPRTHVVDQSSVAAKRLLERRATHGRDFCGPTPGHHRWPAQQRRGCDRASVQIDWEAKQALCPGGKHRAHWRPGIEHRGNTVVHIVFAKSDCSRCPHLTPCATATGPRRSINVRAQPLHEA